MERINDNRPESPSPEERERLLDLIRRGEDDTAVEAARGRLPVEVLEEIRKEIRDGRFEAIETLRKAVTTGLLAGGLATPGEEGILVVPKELRADRSGVMKQLEGLFRPGRLPCPALSAWHVDEDLPGQMMGLVAQSWGEKKSALEKIPDKIAEMALCDRRLPVADARLLLFGDDRGLWCLFVKDGTVMAATCRSPGEESFGSDVQYPLAAVGVENGYCGPLRPGPTRDRFGGLDRAHSPMTYVVSVGESIFRNLTGWGLREVGAKLAEHVRGAYPSYDKLREALLEFAKTRDMPHAIATIPVQRKAAGVAKQLGEVDISKLDTEYLGAEIDTLMHLERTLAPKPGDRFLMLPTDTASSILASILIGLWLGNRFRSEATGIGVNVGVGKNLFRQVTMKPAGGQLRHEMPQDSYGKMVESSRALLDEVLRAGSDAVVVMPGGVKLMTSALMEVARAKRVPIAYRYHEVGERTDTPPLVIRWDMISKDTALGFEAEPIERERVETKHCLIVTVGASLQRGVSKDQRSEEAFRFLVKNTPEERRFELCAELTGFEAWIRDLGLDPTDAAVVLLPEGNVSSRACCGAVRYALKMRGVSVLNELELPDITKLVRGDEREYAETANKVAKTVAGAIQSAEAEGYSSDVLPLPGRTFISAIVQLYATIRGYRVVIGYEAEKGAAAPPAPFWIEPQKSRLAGIPFAQATPEV